MCGRCVFLGEVCEFVCERCVNLSSSPEITVSSQTWKFLCFVCFRVLFLSFPLTCCTLFLLTARLRDLHLSDSLPFCLFLFFFLSFNCLFFFSFFSIFSFTVLLARISSLGGSCQDIYPVTIVSSQVENSNR